MDTLTNQPKMNNFDGPINLNESYKIVENIGFVGPKGDVNNDEYINIVDVVQTIHEILSNYYDFDQKQFWAADLDYSTELDVLDLTKLIEFILTH